ncbi:MAG: N-acetylmuramoyl-L-alanine amidase, partial [Candidatus Zixiibacteriota bacterium]
GYGEPRGDVVLRSGDRLDIMFRGTPGMRAWASLPGVADSIPMAETTPRPQPYWGEAVFGAGKIPDSVLVRGIYSGFVVIPDSARVTDAHVQYHLAPPDRATVTATLLGGVDSVRQRQFLWNCLFMDTLRSASSAYAVSVNPPDYPFTVRFTDSVQTIRYGPRKGYFAIFQPAGVEALVVGKEAKWYRAQLSQTHYAWIFEEAVERLPAGILPPHSYLTVVRTYSYPDSVVIECKLRGKHPFRVIEDGPRTLRVQLFGVTTDTDWIRYDFSDSLIDIATWSQPEDDLYELKLELTQDVWGYESNYVGNTYRLMLRRPPRNVSRLRGKTIVLDPGHSADPGSIGPTGYTEAEANLGIALKLGELLRRKGVNVVMTRSDGSNVPLYDRPAIARAAHADLFVSIHNNALPDGVNPFVNHGVSTYYYHPHSIRLAKAIQRRMIQATDMPDYGLYHGNLAVDRPTQYPAVLVECAFIILPEQEAMLKTERFRRTVAEAILRGIEDFLDEYDRANRKTSR